jgi:hypothetical protein
MLLYFLELMNRESMDLVMELQEGSSTLRGSGKFYSGFESVRTLNGPFSVYLLYRFGDFEGDEDDLGGCSVKGFTEELMVKFPKEVFERGVGEFMNELGNKQGGLEYANG